MLFFLQENIFWEWIEKWIFCSKNENDRRFNIAFRVLFAVMVILLKRQILPWTFWFRPWIRLCLSRRQFRFLFVLLQNKQTVSLLKLGPKYAFPLANSKYGRIQYGGGRNEILRCHHGEIFYLKNIKRKIWS